MTATTVAATDAPTVATTDLPEIASGTWIHNPATGEIGRINIGPAETAGRLLEAELWLQPGAAVVGVHWHDYIIERFELLSGEMGFQLGDSQQFARAGDPMVEAPAGTVHDWWNAGAGVAHVRITVEAAPGAPGRPASRFGGLVEVLFSLASLGQVNDEGVPDALWMAAIAHEFRDVSRFLRPSGFGQPTLHGPLVALARRTGRDPLQPHMHGPTAPCVIPDPGPEGLAKLLARRVNAQSARGH